MKLKQWQNIFGVNTNTVSIVQLAIQIKHGKIKHDSVNAKTIVSIKKIIVGILANEHPSILFNKY